MPWRVRVRAVVFDGDGEVLDAAGVGAFQGIGDAEEGGHFGDADAVLRGEEAVGLVGGAWAGIFGGSGRLGR